MARTGLTHGAWEAADGVHGGGRQPDQRADPRRTQPPFRRQRPHLALEPGGSLARQAVRPAGSVEQPGGTFGSPAGQPLVASRARDVELDHDMGNRAALLDDPADEFGAAMDGQAGISVGHETSGHSDVASAPTPSFGGLPVGSVLDAVNNAHGHHN